MTLSYSTIEGSVKDNLLIQVVRRNSAGQVLRVSSYLARFGKQILVSEMIHYLDGTSSLYLYNEQGEVWQVFTYDKDGLELSGPITPAESRRPKYAMV